MPGSDETTQRRFRQAIPNLTRKEYSGRTTSSVSPRASALPLDATLPPPLLPGTNMELDPHATADLTAFFTKRFPAPEDRNRLARDAKVTFREPTSAAPEVAWGGLLTRAQEQAALPRLARCAARHRPSDENLQGVAAVLNGRQWPPQKASSLPRGWKQMGALTALVAIAGVAWAASGPRDAALPEAHEAALEVSEENIEPVVVATELPPAPEPAAVATPEPEAVATPEPAVVASADPEPEATAGAAAPPSTPEPEPSSGTSAPAIASSSAPATNTGSCHGRPGELVGYWYAGTTAPGGKGDRITVPRDLNVRADYPDRHNNYDRRAPIRCTLGVGQSLVLSADPIAVPGGAYWVPLHAVGR